MVALNFIAQFAHDVEEGIKTQTIRRNGKRNPPKVGDELQLYTGMRTKNCRLLRRVTCVFVEQIRIDSNRQWVSKFLHNGTEFQWVPIGGGGLSKLIVEDGFQTLEEFFNFFASDDDVVFEGHLIKWAL